MQEQHKLNAPSLVKIQAGGQRKRHHWTYIFYKETINNGENEENCYRKH